MKVSSVNKTEHIKSTHPICCTSRGSGELLIVMQHPHFHGRECNYATHYLGTSEESMFSFSKDKWLWISFTFLLWLLGVLASIRVKRRGYQYFSISSLALNKSESNADLMEPVSDSFVVAWSALRLGSFWLLICSHVTLMCRCFFWLLTGGWEAKWAETQDWSSNSDSRENHHNSIKR